MQVAATFDSTRNATGNIRSTTKVGFLTCGLFCARASSISCEMSTPLWRGYDGRCQGSDLRVCLCLVARMDNQLEV